MATEINEQTLIDNGFIKNDRYSTNTFKYYEKDELVLEQSLMSFFKKQGDTKKYLWDLRKKLDGDNSEFIATVDTWDDVSKIYCA